MNKLKPEIYPIPSIFKPQLPKIEYMAYYRNYEYYQPEPVNLEELVMQKVTNGLLLAGLISFLVATIAGPFLPLLFVFAFVGEIVSIIGYFFARRESMIEKLYYLFVSSTAVILGLTILYVTSAVANGLEIIFYAFAITGIIFGGIYYHTASKRPDVTYMVKYLLPASIGFMIILILGFFISFGDGFSLLISIFGAALFSAYLYFDMGRLMQNRVDSPARMAWRIYWDIYLIFQYILRILLLTQRRN